MKDLLYVIILDCILYCIRVYRILLHYIYYITLILHDITVYIILHYIILYYIILYYTILYYIILYYTTLYDTYRFEDVKTTRGNDRSGRMQSPRGERKENAKEHIIIMIIIYNIDKINMPMMIYYNMKNIIMIIKNTTYYKTVTYDNDTHVYIYIYILF